MYIIVSTADDGSIHYYGLWQSSEAARRWGVSFHGYLPKADRWEIVEINRVA